MTRADECTPLQPSPADMAIITDMRQRGEEIREIRRVLGCSGWRLARYLRYMIQAGLIPSQRYGEERAKVAKRYAARAKAANRVNKAELTDEEVERRCNVYHALRFSELSLTVDELAERSGEDVRFVRAFLEETSRPMNDGHYSLVRQDARGKWYPTKDVENSRLDLPVHRKAS